MATTPQQVIQEFMNALVNHGLTTKSEATGVAMLDKAIQASTDYSGIENVINCMKADQVSAEREAVEEILGKSYAGKTIKEAGRDATAKKSQIENRKVSIFLEKYCGIIMGNDDTGAITGSDANVSVAAGDTFYGATASSAQTFGNGTTKTKTSIVDESTINKTWPSTPVSEFTTDTGLTFKLNDDTPFAKLTTDQQTIFKGLYKWWGNECTKLVRDTYNLGFDKSKYASVMSDNITVNFVNNNNNTLASAGYSYSNSDGSASNLTLNVNMKFYSGIEETNSDGSSTGSSLLLDRTLAHEFTHTVMETNVKFFTNLPQFIKEGLAELTHGIDDVRSYSIRQVALNDSTLKKALGFGTGTGDEICYSGGFMFFRYLAKQATLMSKAKDILGSSAGTWSVNKTTATYSVGGKEVAKIVGLRNGLSTAGTMLDGITVSGKTITLSQKVLGTSKVTLTTTDGYSLAFDSDMQTKKVTVNAPSWNINNGTAIYRGDTTAGYNLDGNTVTYTKAAGGKEIVKITGLAKSGISSIPMSDNIITLTGSMLNNGKVTLKGDGYTLATGTGISAPTDRTPYWQAKNGSAKYLQTTSAGYTLSDDKKTLNFFKEKSTNLLTLSGLNKALSSTNSTSLSGVTVSGDTVTLSASALGTSKITLKGAGYKLGAVPAGYSSARNENQLIIGGGKAVYKNVDTAYFTKANDTTYNYTKEVLKSTMATVTGLDKAATGGVSVSGKVITVASTALPSTIKDKAKISLGKNDDYILALGSGLSQSTATKSYWSASKGTAKYQQDMAAGFTFSDDKKTLTYSTAKTINPLVISGLDKTLTDTEGVLSGISVSADKVVTLDNRVLGASNVAIKGTGYTLALDFTSSYAARNSAVKADVWAVGGGKAVYKNVEQGYFTKKNDTTYTYVKEKALATLATVAGLKKTATEADISLSGKVITIKSTAVLDTPTHNSKITLGKKDDYTLAIGDGAPKLEYDTPTFTYAKGKATYAATVKTAGYFASDNQKTLTYIADKDKKGNAITTTFATISGLDNQATGGLSVSGKVISVSSAALSSTLKNNAKISVKGDGYTLAMGDGVTGIQTSPEDRWAVGGTKATLTTFTDTKGFTLSKDSKTLTYTLKTVKKEAGSVSGIKKGLTTSDFATSASGNKISLTAAQLGDKVTLGGEYTFEFAADYKDKTINGSSADNTITVKGTGNIITAAKGDDTITLGGDNTIIYNNGDGSDTVNGFTAGSTLKLGGFKATDTISIAAESNDVVITLKKGNTSGSITLKDAKNLSFDIYDNAKTPNVIASYGKSSGMVSESESIAATEDLLYSDNYAMGSDLSDITGGDLDDFSVTNIETQNVTDLTATTPIITATDKK